MKKLTQRQQHVVDRMREGRGLSRNLAPFGRCWLTEEPGLAGGEEVHMSTYLSLLRAGVIKVVDKGARPILAHKLAEDDGS